MKALRLVQGFFVTKKTLGLIFAFVSVFFGCAACYLAGAYLENGASLALKITLCVAAFFLCGLSCLAQVTVWMSSPRIKYGKLEVNLFVQLLCIDMVALLLCFAIYGPIGFNNPKSFVAISQLAPGAFIFLFLLVSVLLLVTVRAKAYSVAGSTAQMSDGTKKIHELFLPWFLVIYFLLVIAPYSFAPVPAINSFLTGLGKIPYRLVTTAFLAGYSLYLWVKHKLHPRFDLLIPMTLLWGSFALACVFAPRAFSYVSENLNGSFAFVQSTFTDSTIWIQLPLLMCDCFVFFCFASFFPPCVSDKKQVLIPILGILLYVLAACFYSYGKEFSAYVAYLNGSDQSKGAIVSWTQSKNAFGILLVHGAFCATFLAYYVKKWWRVLFAVADLMFLATSYIAQCYSAMVPILALCLFGYMYLIVKVYRRKRLAGIILVGLSLAFLAFVIVCVSLPSIYESNSFLRKIYRKVSYFFDQEILSRTSKWQLSLVVCRGPFALIGKSNMSEMELYLRENSSHLMPYPDFHSSYVASFGTSGLVGLLLYIFSIGYSVRNVWKCKANKMLLLVSVGLLISCILFSMPETYTLFLSMSAIAVPFTYLFVIFLPFLRRNA